MSKPKNVTSQEIIDELAGLDEIYMRKPGACPPESIESPDAEISEKQLAAEALVAQGFKVFPLHKKILGTDCTCGVYGCTHEGKEPVFTGWQKDASNKIDDIDAWWGKNPNWNIGIKTGGGIIVLDVDSFGGVKLLVAEQIRLRENLPKTLTSQTGKGCHLIFSYDPNIKLGIKIPAHWWDEDKHKKDKQKKSKGVEIRGGGGYIVGPGSDHYSGRKYRFLDPSTPIAPLPPAWVKLLAELESAPASQPAPVSSSGTKIDGNGDGRLETDQGRNNAVSHDVYQLVKLGINGNVLVQAAQQINQRICHPQHLLPGQVIQSMCKSKERLVAPDPPPAISPSWAVTVSKNLLSLEKADEFFLNHELGCEDLMAQELPPMKWIVKAILPEGLTLYVGAPKLGKSLFCLDLAICVSNGTKVFGKFQSEQGVALYLALEDGNRRLQYRIGKMTSQYSNRLKIFTKWAQINSKGDMDAINLLERFLDREPETNLVVVDTLGKLSLEQKANKDIYAGDVKRLEGLQQLALERHISILLVHHTKKGDHRDEYNSVSGSNGLAGTADQLWKMHRDDRHESEATLSISGRDVEPIRAGLELDVETLTWNWLGFAKEIDSRKASDKIVDILKTQGKPLGSSKIIELSGMKPGTIKSAIFRLNKTGTIMQAAGLAGRYVLAPEAPYAIM